MDNMGVFDQPTYADLRLLFKISQGGACPTADNASGSPPAKRLCTGLSLADAHSFYTHKVILATKSPVINAMLLRAREQRELHAMAAGLSVHLVPVECSGSVALLLSPPTRQLTVDPPQLEVLELPMEQEELMAGEVLFRSIYSGDLAEEVRSALSSEQGAGVSRVTLLVQVYRLADRLEVCTDQCAQAISALSSADCDSVDVVNYAFSLKTAAPALAEHTAIKVLLDKCLSQLVARYGGITYLLICGENLRQGFRQLDFLPFLAFLDSDDLVVVSENEVLSLMGMWMGEDWAGQISKEQLRAFWNVLRLGHLTTSFITTLPAVAPWLPVDLVVLGAAAAWKCCQDTNPGKAASMQKSLQSAYGSVAWFKDSRKRPEDDILLDACNLSKETLDELLTSVHHSAESRKELHTVWEGAEYFTEFNGYNFELGLSVQLVSDGSKKTFVVSVCYKFETSFLISKGSEQCINWAHLSATCQLGEARVQLGTVDAYLHGTHSWELARVDTLDDFSCLGRYLDQNGNLEVMMEVEAIE